jgi:hypothetical protein
MKNNKLEFGILRKNTHADNYIKVDSYNPDTHKHAIINSLAYRLVNVRSTKKEYNCIIETAGKMDLENLWRTKKSKHKID